MKDIETRDDIKQLVDNFYTAVQHDTLIGPIFIGAIKDWPAHLEKMYNFWSTVLLHEHSYTGSPFLPHADMPLKANHFNNWKAIWGSTIDGMFSGPKADEAKARAAKMALMFQSKIEYYSNNNAKPLL